LSASASSVPVGQSVTLTWSSTNTTACTASGAWTGAVSLSGNSTLTVKANGAYTLTCTGPGGTASQTVSISAVPTPTLWFYPSQITWSTTNTTSCTASGGWSGTQTTSGNQTILPGAGVTTTYLITCTGPGGTLSKTVTITTQ
jgi:hypothetical protein